MKALTAEEMREVDRLTTERFGIPGLQLMENAGEAVASFLRKTAFVATADGKKVTVLCGKGNNGGDGFVVARKLADQGVKEVVVLLFAEPEELRGDAATNFQRWIDSNGSVKSIRDSADWDAVSPEVISSFLIVDALLGTGIRGAVTGLLAQVIEDINRASGNVTLPRPVAIVAVDTPSGLPSDGEAAQGPVLYVHDTVTFTAPKVGQLFSQNSPAMGILKVCPIGSPASLVEEIGKQPVRWAEPQEFAGMPLVRSADSNKGNFGHVLLLAGSKGKSGAAILAGRAALRAGAGLVTLAVPETVQSIVAAGAAEFMTESLAATKSGTLSLRSLLDGTFGELEEGKSVLALGPGLGTHKQTQEFVRTVVHETELSVVLDADGLNAFAGHSESLRKRKTKFLAVTPHPGEMARLLGISTKEVQKNRLEIARESALKWNAYVILKGFHTIVASPLGECFVSTTGNAGLAKGGSGDVLTGLLAALTGQFRTADWVRVLALGVYLHGLAAEIATSANEPSGLLAGELLEKIPAARALLLKEIQRGA
jgi:hydroxyethylthiazole kinase-like uncharacterized protein yjeF